MKKSLMISWISCCDYPLFRLWLRKYGSFFDEILIYFDVQFRHPFFWAFIQQDLQTWKMFSSYKTPEIKFLDPVPYEYGVGDWRNVSTNELVKHATGDWIISIEQDWFTSNWEKLLSRTKVLMESYSMFGWMNMSQNPYIHPAFFGIKRELLEKTSKDFGAHSEINGCDHFGKITYDVQALGEKIATQNEFDMKFEFAYDSDAFHLGGVNQNYLNGMNDGAQLHRPEAFLPYNYECRQIDIPQDPRFLTLSQDIEVKFIPHFDFSVRDNVWSKFFKI